ncbi:hypothetical protein KP509_05G030700 [Ceratopteris richardii]|nr:hypothetical protein KP509_05G030700 [Ceratopteris richardii]
MLHCGIAWSNKSCGHCGCELHMLCWKIYMLRSLEVKEQPSEE